MKLDVGAEQGLVLRRGLVAIPDGLCNIAKVFEIILHVQEFLRELVKARGRAKISYRVLYHLIHL